MTFSGSLGNLTFDSETEQNKAMRMVFISAALIMVVVLLLNLLIAVMAEAYEEVKYNQCESELGIHTAHHDCESSRG